MNEQIYDYKNLLRWISVSLDSFACACVNLFRLFGICISDKRSS
jgi:hypothetical protein